MIYSNGTKTRQKISESRDEHINIDSNRRKTYSLASKTSSEFRTRQKISELGDEHIFFALEYALQSLQRIQR